jgi:hypothetical protein
VNAPPIELVRGRDKKYYPLGLPRPAAEHLKLVALSHTLRCGRKLPYEQIRRTPLGEFGVRRSTGAIFRDVHAYRCPLCTPQPPPPPDPRQKPRTFAWN